MNNLDQQEKQLEIQKLRELIHSIPIEAKKEYEWQLLENTIIAQLEDIEKGVPQKSEKPPPVLWRLHGQQHCEPPAGLR